MFFKKLLAVAGGALALTLAAASPALAQDGSDNPQRDTGDRSQDAQASEVDRDRQTDRRQRRSNAAATPPPPTPAQLMASAQTLITAAAVDCQVTEATQPGVNATQQAIYEAACATGPGYIVIAATPPETFSCLELAGTAATARLRDPAADVGQQCLMAANQNGLAVIGGWAREAGVNCSIDEAVAIGKSDRDNVVYEIGCAGEDGYWLEKIATGWQLQDCLQIASVGGACRFTTTAEQAAGFKPKLAGTEASACDVSQVRLMGSNANGRFYEAKCAAEGEGFIARINNAGVTQQIYPCATAQRIGGGCTLTPAPAATPAE